MSMRQGVGANGQRGTHVDIPLSLGPAKKGVDKHGAVCGVWDFVVHPETVEMAMKNPNIRTTIADTVRRRRGRRGGEEGI